MKIIRISTAYLVCFAMALLIGCSQDPVEKTLNQLEAVVVKWEKQSNGHHLSYKDELQLNQELAKVENQEILLKNDKLTSDQSVRLLQLSFRVKHLTR